MSRLMILALLLVATWVYATSGGQHGFSLSSLHVGAAGGRRTAGPILGAEAGGAVGQAGLGLAGRIGN
ncbi:MAG: hypothetical protein ORN49_06810 [Rhodobacteraceae bacterium]|nr:hypothetical protein [Paracoccaceae bacterium]